MALLRYVAPPLDTRLALLLEVTGVALLRLGNGEMRPSGNTMVALPLLRQPPAMKLRRPGAQDGRALGQFSTHNIRYLSR
jgi:hypothetical protein